MGLMRVLLEFAAASIVQMNSVRESTRWLTSAIVAVSARTWKIIARELKERQDPKAELLLLKTMSATDEPR